MQNTTLVLLLAAMAIAAFYIGRSRSLALVGGPSRIVSLHSLPGYYGYYTAVWSLLPALALMLVWVLVEEEIIVAMVVSGLPEAQQSRVAW